MSINIDAWLKTHAALISPLAMGSTAAIKQDKKFGYDDELLDLALICFRENIKALKDLKIPILPKKYRLLAIIPSRLVKRKIKKLLNSEFGRIALSGHASAAQNEMKKFSDDFMEAIRGVKTDLSSNKKLYELSYN